MSENLMLKFKHFETYATFAEKLNANEISDTDICFIKESSEIYTHGQFYNGSYVNEIVLDSEMSDSSENAVQNKIIKEYIDLHPKYDIISEITAPDIHIVYTD